MRISLSILMVLFFCQCADQNTKTQDTEGELNTSEKNVNSFQTILDSCKLNGSILVFDAKKETYYSNDFQWAKTGFLPASTFKIPNSIIALETGVVNNDSTLFKWDGTERQFKIWEQDLIFKEAFKYSCVPCYQEIARNIGYSIMDSNLNSLGYKNMVFDESNLDMFWLTGDSRITQFEQIDFLESFKSSELPITSRTERFMKDIMIIEKTDNYTLRGKTGWSVNDNKDNGWFVGYLETTDGNFFFATNLEPKKEFNMDDFPRIRKEVTLLALGEIGVLKQ